MPSSNLELRCVGTYAFSLSYCKKSSPNALCLVFFFFWGGGKVQLYTIYLHPERLGYPFLTLVVTLWQQTQAVDLEGRR